MRKVSRRAKVMIAVCTLAAITANGGAAWALWKLGGSGTASAVAGNTVQLTISGRVNPDAPLYPGLTTGLAVTVSNPNSFSVTVTRVRPGTGPVVVDAAHRSAGCMRTGVSLTRPSYAVSWKVGPNAKRLFVLSRSVRMDNTSDNACQGGSFEIPMVVTGTSG